MGTNVIKKKNTFLNIIICNFNEEIQKMKFLENTQQTEPKEYIHKFYGWNFYDYGKDLDLRKIDKILDKLKFFCDKKEYQNFC
jgi:hypothetical protein